MVSKHIRTSTSRLEQRVRAHCTSSSPASIGLRRSFSAVKRPEKAWAGRRPVGMRAREQVPLHRGDLSALAALSVLLLNKHPNKNHPLFLN